MSTITVNIIADFSSMQIGDTETCLFLRLKSRGPRVASLHLAFIPDFTRFLPWLTSGWVLLQWNENVESVQILSYCICVWCESGELGGRRSLRFPCVTPVVETFSSDRISFRTPSNISNTAPLRKQLMALTCRMLPQKSPTTDFRPDFKCGSDWGAVNVGCGWTASAWNF